MPSIEVISVVLCEEVRREYDGRSILIGAAPVGPEIPEDGDTVPRIAFYVEALVNSVTEVEFRLVSDSDENVAFEAKMQLSDPQEDNVPSEGGADSILGVLVFNKANIFFKQPGKYRFQVRVPDQDWQNARNFFFPPRDA